ncbi:MAG: VPLPA-CTERM sorting domain-containing protein [Pseudomonadota bacterium]
MRFTKSVGAAVAAALSLIAFSAAHATVIAYGQPGFPSVTVTPNTFTQAFFSDDSNTDVGNQSPANVQTVLESWFGQTLYFVGGGACGASPTYANNCAAYENGVKGGISNLTAQIFAVHFGNNFLAFLYPGAIDGFQIDGLRFGVSNIYAFNAPEIPVPAAAWLMGSALGGFAFAARRRKNRL